MDSASVSDIYTAEYMSNFIGNDGQMIINNLPVNPAVLKSFHEF